MAFLKCYRHCASSHWMLLLVRLMSRPLLAAQRMLSVLSVAVTWLAWSGRWLGANCWCCSSGAHVDHIRMAAFYNAQRMLQLTIVRVYRLADIPVAGGMYDFNSGNDGMQVCQLWISSFVYNSIHQLICWWSLCHVHCWMHSACWVCCQLRWPGWHDQEDDWEQTVDAAAVERMWTTSGWLPFTMLYGTTGVRASWHTRCRWHVWLQQRQWWHAGVSTLHILIRVE